MQRLAPLALGAAVLAGCGGSAKTLSVDESAGRVGPVKIGETRAAVVAALGQPGDVRHGGPYAPLGEWYEEIGGPPTISVPGPGEVLRYHHIAVLLESGRVYSVIASGNAHTRAGPGTGDSLSEVKAAFEHGECSTLGAESGAEIPYCTFAVHGAQIAFGKDPVRSITLTKRRR